MLKPKLFTTLETYSRKTFMDDLFAGLTVGVVALPLAMAFAIASGVPPERGLFTAIIAGFLISLLGGSRVQIGGPTGAFVIIVSGIMAEYGYEGLVYCTIMAGFFLIALGLSKMGGLIKFIPFPVITGFTSGIAVVIFSTQIKDLLGLHMPDPPAEFIPKWIEYVKHLGTFTPAAAGLGAETHVPPEPSIPLPYTWTIVEHGGKPLGPPENWRRQTDGSAPPPLEEVLPAVVTGPVAAPTDAAADSASPTNPGASAPQGELVLTAKRDSWVEVTDLDRSRLHFGLIKGGEQVAVTGKPPYDLVIGNAPAVTVTFRGAAVDVNARAINGVARMAVGEP